MTTVHSKFVPAKTRTRAKKNYLRLRSAGYSTTMAPSEPVRQHIHRLHEWGLGLNTIARLAGIGHERVHDIYRGEGKEVRLRVAAAIMGVSFRPRPDGIMVLGIGARRRVQALQAAGHTVRVIEETCGLPHDSMCHTVSRQTIRWETWKAISDGYDQLANKQGPSTRAKNRAIKEGWPSPWDWETTDIDNPDAWPSDLKRVTRNDKRAEGLALLSSGLSRKAVAQRLDVAPRTVERWVAAEKRKNK